MKHLNRILTIFVALAIFAGSCIVVSAKFDGYTKPLLGNANGDDAVNAKDVLLIRKYIAKQKVTLDLNLSDLNYDGKVNAVDVLTLRKCQAKILDIDFLTYYPLGDNDYANNADYELVWSDEFNDDKLDKKTWRFEQGFVRNNEPQYYTTRKQNIDVENGCLRITAIKEEYGDAHYTSASINTKNSFNFKYGIAEIRAKLPTADRAPACWPAFWMMGTTSGWPYCGETDIMEAYLQKPNKYEANVHWAGQNSQYRNLWHTVGSVPTYTNPNENVGDGWHIIGLEWTPKYMRFFCDGVTIGTVDITDPVMSELHYSNYILLNMALQPELAGKAKDDQYPANYFVDYVRVYQLKAQSEGN